MVRVLHRKDGQPTAVFVTERTPASEIMEDQGVLALICTGSLIHAWVDVRVGQVELRNVLAFMLPPINALELQNQPILPLRGDQIEFPPNEFSRKLHIIGDEENDAIEEAADKFIRPGLWVSPAVSGCPSILSYRGEVYWIPEDMAESLPDVLATRGDGALTSLESFPDPTSGANATPAETAQSIPQTYLQNRILGLLREGSKIRAIKLYLEETNVGLKEAKEAVEELQRMEAEGVSPREPAVLPRTPDNAADLHSRVLDVLREWGKIQAIKLYRQETDASLKEAKEAVEKLQSQEEQTQATPKRGAAGPRPAEHRSKDRLTTPLPDGAYDDQVVTRVSEIKREFEQMTKMLFEEDSLDSIVGCLAVIVGPAFGWMLFWQCLGFRWWTGLLLGGVLGFVAFLTLCLWVEGLIDRRRKAKQDRAISACETSFNSHWPPGSLLRDGALHALKKAIGTSKTAMLVLLCQLQEWQRTEAVRASQRSSEASSSTSPSAELTERLTAIAEEWKWVTDIGEEFLTPDTAWHGKPLGLGLLSEGASFDNNDIPVPSGESVICNWAPHGAPKLDEDSHAGIFTEKRLILCRRSGVSGLEWVDVPYSEIVSLEAGLETGPVPVPTPEGVVIWNGGWVILNLVHGTFRVWNAGDYRVVGLLTHILSSADAPHFVPGPDAPNLESMLERMADLSTRVLALLRQGKKIEAIKLYRAETKVGLKEAKDAVERL